MTRDWLLTIAVIAAAVTLALALRASAESGGTAAVEHGQHARCFSAALWSADDSQRPCWRIGRVAEDGSAAVRLSTGRLVARCHLPAADGGQPFCRWR